MEPPRFTAREPARDLDPPTADAEVVLEGVAGEALITSLLEGNGILGDVEWGADQLVVWEDGEASCVRWDIRSDTVAGLADLEGSFRRWSGIVGGATVERLGPETIRVDRCS